MNFYILDDDMAVVKTMKHIIKSQGIGTVVGCNTDVECAIADIREEQPDIILVDFLMKEMDGIAFIQEVKKFQEDASFIMISKVSDKSLVGKAYDAGVEFFIHKPINVREIQRVTQNVMERKKLRKVVDNIQSAFREVGDDGMDPSALPKSHPAERKQNWLDVMLGSFGILGEKGTGDIRRIYERMDQTGEAYSKTLLSDVAEAEGDSAKNVEQRIRRALKKALANVAVSKLDGAEEDSQIYAKYVFDHLSIKAEMNYQEGYATAGGRVSISKFMDGLMAYRDLHDE